MARLDWSDEHVMDASMDDAVALLPRAIEDSFGETFAEIEVGVWRGQLSREGKRFDVTVTAAPRGAETAVKVAVSASKSALSRFGVPAYAVLTATAYVISAIAYAILWDQPSMGGLTPTLLLLVPIVMTAAATRLIAATRLDGMVMMGDAESLVKTMRRIETAPRKGGYRTGPRIAADPARYHAEALAELEAEADDEADVAIQRAR